MIWSKMLFDKENIKPEEMNDLQKSISVELYNKVDVQYKLLKLRNYVLEKKGSSKRISGSSKNTDFISLIYYYDLYYENGIWQKDITMRFDRPAKMPHLSKYKRVYCKEKIEEYLEKYKLSKSIESIVDDDFVVYMISLMPNSVFDTKETDLLKKIYEFATTQKLEFRIIDRKSKLEKEKQLQTYIEFAKTFDISQESCKSRFFVRLFCQYSGEQYTRVDDFLRYKADKKFFSPQDYLNIGITEIEFFNVIDKIKRTSKK